MKWGSISGCARASLPARSGHCAKVIPGADFSCTLCRASLLLGLECAAAGLQQWVHLVCKNGSSAVSAVVCLSYSAAVAGGSEIVALMPGRLEEQ